MGQPPLEAKCIRAQERSLSPVAPACLAQFAQQKTLPSCSTPWPMTLQPQCVQAGASAWIAHSKESKVCSRPPIVILNDLSYSLPHTSHFAMSCPLFTREFRIGRLVKSANVVPTSNAPRANDGYR